MGFPRQFILPVPRPKSRERACFGESEAYRQMGNAVCPPVIQAIASRLLLAAGFAAAAPWGRPADDDDAPAVAVSQHAVTATPAVAAPTSTAEAADDAADAALLTASIADRHLQCAPVPRRLRGRPLILPPVASLRETTTAALSSCQLLAMPTLLIDSTPTQLRVLDLSYNSIKELPDTRATWLALGSLNELDVSHNLLKALPTALHAAASLRRLNLRSNQLLQGCGTDFARGWRELCAPALSGLRELTCLDMRYNPRVRALDEATLREDLPGAVVGAEGAPSVLLGAEAGVPIRRGSELTKCQAGDGDGPSRWPTLLAQLAPLSTPAVLHRLHSVFGIGTGRPEADYAAVGSSRDKLLYQLVEAYGRAARLATLSSAQSSISVSPPRSELARLPESAPASLPAAALVDSARCRREVRCEGAPIPDEICTSLRAALEGARWPTQSDRPKVASASYLVLERPPSGAPTESAGARRGRAKRERHGALWDAVAAWMAHVDPGFEYTGVALSRDFRGSPHVDTYDISYQWAISLGDFQGGELCVESGADEVSVVTTRNRAAKVDGRYPHWVAPWVGAQRYSAIVYKTRGEGTPQGPAVYPAKPACLDFDSHS